MARLDATDLVVGYDGTPIVQGASVWCQSGEVSVLLGANGAGKSTLAKAIVGLLTPTAGTVRFESRDVTRLQPYERIHLGMGYLPQLMNVFDELTVMENLEMGGFTLRGERRGRINDVLSLFPDLQKDTKKKAGHLSGGQQRMLGLARVLMLNPQVIVLDEPTAGLSPFYADLVWNQIDRIRDLGVGLLVVEQSVRIAMKHADYAFVLSNGRVLMHGPAAQVASNEELASLFVG